MAGADIDSSFQDFITELGQFQPSGNREKLLVTGIKLLCDKIKKLECDLGKTDQYSRRGTITVVGLPMAKGEKADDLANAVAGTISVEGLTVKPTDFAAIHRNSQIDTVVVKKDKSGKTVTDRSGQPVKITKPPAITVRFNNLNIKDKVMRSYKNTGRNNCPKPVCIYQSMNQYYTNLNDRIPDYITSESTGLEVRWIFWRTATCGLAVKLKDGKLFTKIHAFGDFLTMFNQYSR